MSDHFCIFLYLDRLRLIERYYYNPEALKQHGSNVYSVLNNCVLVKMLKQYKIEICYSSFQNFICCKGLGFCVLLNNNNFQQIVAGLKCGMEF
jgi:hypothetical protein